MLQYQITDDKEENDLLEGLIGSKNQENDKVKYDQIISTEKANRT